MPSCQISFSIDGLALGVATAIVERTYVSPRRLAQEAIGQVDPSREAIPDVVDGDAVLGDVGASNNPDGRTIVHARSLADTIASIRRMSSYTVLPSLLTT